MAEYKYIGVDQKHEFILIEDDSRLLHIDARILAEIYAGIMRGEFAERKHGRWEKDGETTIFGDIRVKCSQCGFKTLQDVLHKMDYHYCPNCGAQMDEEN